MAGAQGDVSWFDRLEECTSLERLLDDVRGNRSATLVIRGEAGIGKTRLLEYAAAHAVDARVMRAVGVESEMELAVAGMHQLTVPVLDGGERLPGPQRAALQTAFGLVSGPAPDHFFVGLAALTLLSDVARERPVLCVVDDAQWLDQGSAELLAFVPGSVDADPVGFVFAMRDPVEGRDKFDGLPQLHLRGLPSHDARRLLRSVAPGSVRGALADRLIADTGGNPLALVELGGDLAERGGVQRKLPGTDVLAEPMPVGRRLEEMFLRRVRALPAQTQAPLVLVAAEPPGDPRLGGGGAAELGIDVHAAEPAEVERLLVTGSVIGFGHPLTRSAVYHGAPMDERRAVHRALASVADPDGDSDQRAWHLSLSVIGVDEDVAAEVERAARGARARGGYASAAALLERAALLTPDEHLRARRLLAAAQADLTAGAPDRAEDLLDQAPPGLDDPLARAEAAQLRGGIRLATGQTSEAPSILLAAARAFEPVNERLARETLLEAFFAALYAGWPPGGEGMSEIARTAQTMQGDGPLEGSVADLLLAGFAARVATGYPSAVPLLRRAIGVLGADDLGADQGLRWLGPGTLAALELSDEDAVHSLRGRWVQLARDSGALTLLAVALGFRCTMAEVPAGRFTAAETCLAEARAIAAATGNPGTSGEAGVDEIALLAWRGREAETRQAAAAIAREAADSGRGGDDIFARYALSILDLGLGNYRGAMSCALTVVTDDAPFIATHALPELVEAAARCGEREQAVTALGRLTERAQASETPLALGLLARSRALLAGDADAEQLYVAAIGHLRQCLAAPQLARAHLVYGEWLRRQRRRRDARTQLRTAHNILADMGADAFAERARMELRAAGEQPRKRSIDTAGVLTPQEAQIARLASEGQRNREIAAHLFISPSTVEYHLRKVYSKLGVTSRTNLARALSQHDVP